MSDPSSPHDVLAWLLEESHELAPDRIGAAIAEAMSRLGARSSCLYLVDHDQTLLHPLEPRPPGHAPEAVDGTVAGRSFGLQSVQAVAAGDSTRLWVPLVDGTARLGTLAVDLDPDDAADTAVRAAIERLASLAADLIVTKDRYTDVIECTRRRQPMSLQAEMQRAGLPPDALITSDVAVAGILLPAYEVAGDTFDYSLNDHSLDVVMIDSVGHDLGSAMVSHLVSSALRNARRNGLTLEEAYAAADAALSRVFPDLQFATAAFGSLDLRTGRFRWVSAGHPPPLLLRGDDVLGEATVTPVVPIGLGAKAVAVNEVALEAGDGLLLYTDGVTEGGARGTERFGLDRLVDLLGRSLVAGLAPAELVRRLVVAVLQHTAYELHDDTAVLLVKYRRPPP